MYEFEKLNIFIGFAICIFCFFILTFAVITNWAKLKNIEKMFDEQKQTNKYLEKQIWKIENPPDYKKGQRIGDLTITGIECYPQYSSCSQPIYFYLYVCFDNKNFDTCSLAKEGILNRIKIESNASRKTKSKK